MPKVTITIDGQQVQAEAGSTVLEAAMAAGIDIPHLCHHPALKPEGNCRVCLVEIERQRTLQAACVFPISDGMVIYTDSPKVVAARKFMIDLLLSDHPLDCMTCEAAGRCELQALAYKYGVKQSSLPGVAPRYQIDDTNPFYIRDYNKCILCRRCVRACQEINGVDALGVAGRGFDSRIIAGLDVPMQESSCEFCGMCVELCPTGALLPKQTLGQGRYWEFKHTLTTCPYCGVGCQLDVLSKDQKIVRVQSAWGKMPNDGGTCVKGRFGLDYVNSPERLTSPLIKKNGEFVEASWDEALDLVADKLAETVTKYGADAVGFLSSAKCTNEENYLMQKLARAVIGTNNVDHCARLCHSVTVTGLVTAFGSGAMTNSIADIANQAKAYLIIGSNTTEQHPVIGMRIRKAVRERGAKLLVADPRDIPIAEFAILHLKQRPGTDIALLNAIMNVLISEGLYDKGFVTTRTEGFEELKAKVAEYTPQRAEAITGVPADDIRKAARILATNKPASLLYTMGITQHTTGHQNVLSCANLQMLLGNMGVPGGGVNPLRGQNNVQGACDMGCLVDFYPGYQRVVEQDKHDKFLQAWGRTAPMKSGLTVVEMLNAAEAGTLKAMYILGENPMMTDPDINHVRKCLESLDFLLVQEIFMSETAPYADVILPGVTFAEKEGTFTNTERRVQRVQQVIEPLKNAWPDWQITCEIAKRLTTRLGLSNLDAPFAGWDYSYPSQIMEEIAAMTPIYAGISYDRIESEGLQWPCPTKDHPGTPILHVGKFSRGLGHFTAVDWQPPYEEPDEEYPFLLTTGRVLYHFHGGTMTRRAEGLAAIYPKGKVEINPQDAAKLGIANGDLVKVASRRGEIVAEAEVVARPDPGVVFMTFHFKEAAANLLTVAALDPVGKIPEFKVCAVSIAKMKELEHAEQPAS